MKVERNFYYKSQKKKEERYSRGPRLLYTRYSAKGTKGKLRYARYTYGYVGGRHI